MIKARYLIVVLILFCFKSGVAQQIVPAWGGGADLHDMSFGFVFQYVATDYKIIKKPDWRTPYYDKQSQRNLTDSLAGISSKASQGFAIGFIARYRVTDHLEIRSTPTLVFADRLLDYSYNTASQNVEKQLQTTMVEFPISFKLKSDRLGNFRAYLLGGVKYSGLIGSKKQDDPNADPLSKNIANIKGYASYEAGIGFDIYFEYFKLSPELKLSNSFGNMLVADNNNPYSRPIDKLFLHTIMFSFYFE